MNMVSLWQWGVVTRVFQKSKEGGKEKLQVVCYCLDFECPPKGSSVTEVVPRVELRGDCGTFRRWSLGYWLEVPLKGTVRPVSFVTWQ
jgi:hypothetical protein